jgi:tyrosyl-tRNA synthetase
MPTCKPSVYDIVSVLVESSLVSSRSEARRAIEQGGVRIDGETVSDVATPVAPNSVVQKGKMHFVRVS